MVTITVAIVPVILFEIGVEKMTSLCLLPLPNTHKSEALREKSCK